MILARIVAALIFLEIILSVVDLMRTHRMNRMNKRGYSTLEMLVVVAMSLIITAIAIPSYTNIVKFVRIAGDLRNINGIAAQAKMRAAANFTRSRLYVDLAANTYHLEIWSKSGAGCWQTDGDTKNPCTVASSPVFNLSQGDVFGFGALTSGPTPGQAAIAQATPCRNAVGANIANTACIVFNSRGIPINSNPTTPTPIATDAIYITNGNVVDGVTVSATGFIQAWSTNAGSSWAAQ